MNIINFLNSNFFIALITLFVGIFAICLYIKQKKDNKRDGANIIIMEIRNAEKVSEQLKKHGLNFNQRIEKLLPTNNWTRYNHLFIKDFDIDELNLVNNFYNECSAIDNALSQLDISNQLDHKGAYIQKTLTEIASSAENFEDFKKKKGKFLDIIIKEGYTFQPETPTNILIGSLNNLVKITTSTAGEKLKIIAKIK